MWLLLISMPVQEISEHTRLIITIIFSCIMVIAVIFFFALYFLWIDSMNGYTQGLRSALMNYQPILLDFPTAFFFSFSCYFCSCSSRIRL
jgi:Trk-type K+ transport system membrane component